MSGWRVQLAYGANHPGGLSSDASLAGYAPAVGGGDAGSVSGGSYSGGRNNFAGRGGIASYQTSGNSAIPPKNNDPYGGLGPPQFNPMFGPNNQVATLSSTPLTSYAPPPTEDDNTIVLDPDFNGSFLDLSVLPYNPQLELPVALHVPLSGGGAITHVCGNCLKFVQCTELGNDILSREYELHKGGGDESGTRRSLMKLVRRGEEDDNTIQASIADNKNNNLRRSPSPPEQDESDIGEEEDATITEAESLVDIPFDPPLRTEVVYTSMYGMYINVDCTTPKGVDRGVAKQLVTSDMTDVIYSPNIHDVARLFAPPVNAYGRAVVMLRHPLERSVAKYNWLIRTNEDVKKMSLVEFAQSGESVLLILFFCMFFCPFVSYPLFIHITFSSTHTQQTASKTISLQEQ